MPLRRPFCLRARQLQQVFAFQLNSNYPNYRSNLSFQACHGFHCSAARAAEEHTHYDTLNLPHTATATDIKRRYYELSKTHHPDRNPKDPSAAGRFARISDAYAIIGNTIKREKYDRDLVRTHGVRHQRTSGPAGGRPASGLSRRRTQFHGPPPSFFKNGGLGKTTRAASSSQGAANMGGVGGFGISGAQTGRNDDVPHFDFERHKAQQERRRRPVPRADFEFSATSGMIVPMLGIVSLLFVAIALASRDPKTVKKPSNDTTQ